MTDGPPAAGPPRSRAAAILGRIRRRIPPRLPRVLAVAAVAVLGAAVGSSLAPSTTTTVGPLLAEVRVVPSLQPGVRILLPPAGEVRFATHKAPVSVTASIRRVDAEDAREVLARPTGLDDLARDAPDILRAATIRAALVTSGCALLGAILLGLLVYRRSWRRVRDVAGVVTLTLVATAGTFGLTFDPDRFAQPRFTGLLSQAPYIAGAAPSLVARLESYRSGLADIVQSVTTLYATSGSLPVLPGRGSQDLITVLHVSDIHLNPLAFDLIDRLVRQFNVDVVVDTGDITTWGTEVESQVLSRIRRVGVPYVFVRGNHDSVRTQAAVARSRNAVILNGGVKEVAGIVMAGTGDPAFTPDDPQDVPSAGPPAGSSISPSPTAERSARQAQANTSLARSIQTWNLGHPERPVQLAAVHEPVGLEPLLGEVPLILAGHTHRRDVSEPGVDRDGARVASRLMVEGSTGGAGITSAGLRRLTDGSPVPLAASLLYIARSGERAGRLVAYDEVTVGGFGLASASLRREVVRAEPPTAATGTVPEPSGSTGGR